MVSSRLSYQSSSWPADLLGGVAVAVVATGLQSRGRVAQGAGPGALLGLGGRLDQGGLGELDRAAVDREAVEAVLQVSDDACELVLALSWLGEADEELDVVGEGRGVTELGEHLGDPGGCGWHGHEHPVGAGSGLVLGLGFLALHESPVGLYETLGVHQVVEVELGIGVDAGLAWCCVALGAGRCLPGLLVVGGGHGWWSPRV
jgi:hypothetical protein